MRPSSISFSSAIRATSRRTAIEGGDDDGFRRVVDDEVDARQVLERADVATLASDDSALHVVGGQLDDGDGRFCRWLAATRWSASAIRARARRLDLRSRLLLLLADAASELVPDPGPQTARAGGASPRRRSARRSSRAARAPRPFAAFSSSWSCLTCVSRSRKPPGRDARPLSICATARARSGGDQLLGPSGLGTPLPHFVLDLAPKPDGLLARLDLRLASGSVSASRSSGRSTREPLREASGEPSRRRHREQVR